MQKIALIVAGGSGTRMETNVPKQFLLLAGKPILMHTLEAFYFAGVNQIILVLPQSQIEFWNQLCQTHGFTIQHQLVAGGASRFESVNNGLQQCNDNDLVAIHDGVRPFISKEIILNSFETALEKGNAVATVRLKDSIRKVELLGNKNVNRDNYYLIQTPQTFKVELIKEAYAAQDHINFTDDASVLEANGHAINLIAGDYKNIKITTPEDMLIAEAFLKTK
ncbi:MAG: 2-C-methyl-D-erythritol 4-phosphate cytidylyltransferase [Bacteroidota bacterium]|jgi:2-C-methyl-D-erythritol 4-phosphate cytidylyltransferase